MKHSYQSDHHTIYIGCWLFSLCTIVVLSGCGSPADTVTPTAAPTMVHTATPLPATPTVIAVRTLPAATATHVQPEPTTIPTAPTAPSEPEPVIVPIVPATPTQPEPTAVPTALAEPAQSKPTTAPAAPAAQSVDDVGVPAGFKLVFSDGFDGPQLDSSKWTTCYHWAEKLNGILSCATKNELQLFQPDNVTLENGIVRLRVEKESAKVKAYDREHDYTSGMITTFNKFQFKYGYAEVRARMPQGRGFLSAFWTMPIDKTWPPEIDVIEVLGQDPAMAHLTLHFPKNGEKWKDDKDGGKFRGSDLSAEFNTFAAKWDETGVIWYVNGVERHRTDKSPNEPMYLLATLALGGNWAGPPDEQTPFPAYMDIDYIRVYQR